MWQGLCHGAVLARPSVLGIEDVSIQYPCSLQSTYISHMCPPLFMCLQLASRRARNLQGKQPSSGGSSLQHTITRRCTAVLAFQQFVAFVQPSVGHMHRCIVLATSACTTARQALRAHICVPEFHVRSALTLALWTPSFSACSFSSRLVQSWTSS